MTPFIRRVRKSEIALLRAFCFSDTRDNVPYKHYSLWLEKVLKDFETGDTRVAIGAFLPIIKDSDVLNYELIGCVFLKRSDFDDAIELKSLLTSKESYLKSKKFDINESNFTKVVKANMIEKAVRFCEIREFPKIEIEILHDQMRSEIELFLELGFKVSSLREKYNKGNLVYILEKQIGDTFQADPFDDIKIARWFIQKVLPSKILPDQTYMEEQFSITKIAFERNPIKQYDTNKNEICQFQLKGEVLIVRTVENELISVEKVSKYFDSECQIRFILSDNFAFNIEKDVFSLKNSILSTDFLKCFAGGEKSSLHLPFSNDEVGGAITVLESDAIINYSKNEFFAYYLISGIGSALDISEEDKLILAIYCPYWSNNKGGIIGYSEVVELEKATFDDAYNSFPDIPQSLTERDLQFYKKFSNENEEIVILKCSKIKFFDEIISLQEYEKVFKTDYLFQQLSCNLASSVYLDVRSVTYFRGLGKHYLSQDKEMVSESKPMINFFIMYSIESSDHKLLVQNIADKLVEKGFNVMHDDTSLQPGDRKEEKLLSFIEKSNFFILICTNEFIKRIDNPGHFLFTEWAKFKEQLRIRLISTTVIPVIMSSDVELNYQLNYYTPFEYYKSNLSEFIDYIDRIPK
jgi:hypothetical protein